MPHELTPRYRDASGALHHDPRRALARAASGACSTSAPPARDWSRSSPAATTSARRPRRSPATTPNRPSSPRRGGRRRRARDRLGRLRQRGGTTPPSRYHHHERSDMTRHLVSTSSTPRAGPAPAGARPALPRAARRRARRSTGRSRPSATARSSSGCCTPTATATSSSRPARATPTARSPSTAADGPSTSCPAAPSGDRDWLARLLAHAERIVAGAYAAPTRRRRPREEAFVGVAPRTQPRAVDKHAVAATRFLWVDVDRPERLDALWALLAERPCHLLIESGGSGGVHAYWKLDRAARRRPRDRPDGDGRRADRARQRATRSTRSASTPTGGPTSPTRAARERVARDAPGRHGQPQDRRVGARDPGRPRARRLPDRGARRRPARPAPPRRAAARRARSAVRGPVQADRAARVLPAAGRHHASRAAGWCRCPVPGHDDTHPSCSVGARARAGLVLPQPPAAARAARSTTSPRC